MGRRGTSKLPLPHSYPPWGKSVLPEAIHRFLQERQQYLVLVAEESGILQKAPRDAFRLFCEKRLEVLFGMMPADCTVQYTVYQSFFGASPQKAGARH